jgi:hypothetical protein
MYTFLQEHHPETLIVINPPSSLLLPRTPENWHNVTEADPVVSDILRSDAPQDVDVKQQSKPTLPCLPTNGPCTPITKRTSTPVPQTEEGDDAVYWSQFSDDSIMSWGDFDRVSESKAH